MFAQLKSIVDLVRMGILDLRDFQTKKARDDAVLDMLRVYFVLKDCVEDGEYLVAAAQPNPVATIAKMEPNVALETMEQWDKLIRRQGIRLSQLQSAFLGQHHIAIINPGLQERITEIIGDKMDRTVTLHGIGAALFFKNMFPVANTVEEKARYISVMAGEEGDALDMSRITAEIEGLRQSLNDYRIVVERMVTDDELLKFSERARRETRFPDEA
jgi:hypothetical protein